MSRDQVLTEQSIDSMVRNGDVIVIFQDYVLRLNSWMANHPGGRLAILHMVGRDATNEITSYHSAETLRTMKAFRIGRKPAGHWINRTPPIRGGFKQDGPVPDVSLETSDESILDVVDEKQSLLVETESVDDGLLRVTTRDSSTTTSCSRSSSKCSRRIRSDSDDEQRVPTPLLQHDVEKQPLPSAVKLPLSPEQYTDWAIQQGRNYDSQDYPAVDIDIQNDIANKYMQLHEKISARGLYNCPYLQYGKEAIRYLTLFAIFLVTLRQDWYLTSSIFLGLFWHQIMFTAHDAGHRAITQIFAVDTLIGMFIADFCCGLSIGWWKSSHNVHHLITNQPEHDPDIQNVPLFATCPSFFKSLRSSYYDFTFVWDAVADFMVPYQKYTYYPVMGIARFNLYLLSWLHVLSAKSSGLGSSKAWWIRPAEISFMAGYWFIFGYLLLWRTLPDWTTRVLFVLISHIITMPLHVQITLSHWGMSTSDLGENESFAQRQLRTTMDVDCPAWLDFIHGGLQFQAVHHLFPRVPRHNLRKVQVLVREFCQETSIPYAILGFVDGNRKVLSRLDQVSEQVKMLASCQKYMAETGESGLH